MRYGKLLSISLIVFIIGDLLMLLIWFPVLMLGVGIPAFVALVWLLMVHITSFRTLRVTGYIAKKLLFQQFIAGLIITILNSIAIFMVLSFSESTAKSEHTVVYWPSIVLFAFCVAVMGVFLKLALELVKIR